jgi:hypothetical protein
MWLENQGWYHGSGCIYDRGRAFVTHPGGPMARSVRVPATALPTE